MKNLLNNIRIVLVETSHPGNIGSTVRAMKTMGLSSLYLVNPLQFPHPKATAMAANADDLLVNARVVNHLHEAISDCALVISTSARTRATPWPVINPRECAEKCMQEALKGPVAIVFGREKSGLTNEELQASQFHVQIPTIAEYCSLNLAQAVQVIAYECRVAMLAQCDAPQVQEDDVEYPTAEALEGMYQHFEETLVKIGFLDAENPMLVMPKLKRLLNRARVEKMEVRLLRGILKQMQRSV